MKKRPLPEDRKEECLQLKAIFNAKKKELGLTQEKLAHQLEMNQSSVSHYLNAVNPLNANVAAAFSRILKVPVREFSKRLADEIEMLVLVTPDHERPYASKVASQGYLAQEEVSTYRAFDLASDSSYTGVNQHTARAAAGDGEENSHVEIRGVLAFKSEWLRLNRLNPKNLDVIYANGCSMEPTINSGDVLLIDRSKIEPKDGQIFAMYSEAKGTIVKRLIQSDFDGWLIRSDNPDKARYGDETLRDGEINEVRIIGRVVWRGGML
ncbi:LexA family transcriptional regulator [Pseudomonas protegens]|uniref:LexA family transcriptional regulator n=2 Tax=Pseudomonas protegens TaxID=380021 RepID=UPI001FF0ACFE|nr:LexA family transcriptional regulator [Pseudomonas protegens]